MTKHNEWYTPAKYVDAAREVMGGIDLDPASCAFANLTVKAARYYTTEENGLLQPWSGRTWLNPPFVGRTHGQNKSTNSLWVEKLVRHYQAGEIEQAVLLTVCRIDASWFRQLWTYPICFSDHKVGFYGTETKKILQEQSHPLGTIFVYFGNNEQRFIEVFSRFGTIAKAVSPQKVRPALLELWT
jgi:hypothetical protein